MKLLLLPLHPNARPGNRSRGQTPLEAAQAIRLLNQAGLDPAQFTGRTQYHDQRFEMRNPCGCQCWVEQNDNSEWRMELMPCHALHYDEADDTPNLTAGIQAAHAALQANERITLPTNENWEKARRKRCDLCYRRRMCATWQRNITDLRNMNMCRQCHTQGWPPLEPRASRPGLERSQAMFDTTYAKPDWPRRLMRLRQSMMRPPSRA